jgi:hypothetical protein
LDSEIIKIILNSMKAPGALFERLFKVVDGYVQHQFAELAVPSARVDSGAEPTLDGRKGKVSIAINKVVICIPRL